MSPRDILLAAADVLEKPDAWIQAATARTGPTGRSVRANDPAASCFCLIGSLMHVIDADGLYPDDAPEGYAAFLLLDKELGLEGVASWNDRIGRTQAEVVAALRRTAHKAEEQVLDPA